MAWHGPTERGEVLWERRGTCWNNLLLLYVWAVMSTSSNPGDGKSRKTCLEPQKNKAFCFPRACGAHMGRMKPQRAEAQEMLTLWAMLPCAKPPCEAAAGGDRQNAET